MFSLTFVIWFLIITSLVLSFLSIVFPLIPAPVTLWSGFFLYFFFIDKQGLSPFFWVSMVILTLVLLLSDIIVNSYFVKRFGGSKLGERVAAIGAIVGSFFPPLGILIVPFLAVIVTELLQRREPKRAFNAAVGSFFGFIGGTFFKIIIITVIIIWFVLAMII
ncbi:MAG: DUF456 domain-containing protein [Bacillota bacterium]